MSICRVAVLVQGALQRNCEDKEKCTDTIPMIVPRSGNGVAILNLIKGGARVWGSWGALKHLQGTL